MRIIHAASELKPGARKVCLGIGFFDGVHLGHQQVIRQTIADARQHEGIAVVVTFNRHPSAIVAPNRVPPLIYSLPRKLRAIEALGTDVLWLIDFDKAFSEKSGEEFIRGLARDFGHLRSICVGANFVFGHKRSGNVELLQQLGAELGFNVHGLAAVALDGLPVSSTRIREAIRAGNLDAASQMLGRAYSIAGKVVRGDRLGRQLGFPTANIDAAGLVLPPNGVYAVQAEFPLAPSDGERAGVRGRVGGQRYRAVLNVGYRPTLNNPQPALRVEAHLLGFEGDLYEQELEVVFVEKLREEKRFGSLEALREQIERDIVQAQTRFDE